MADNETWYYAQQGMSIGPVSAQQMDALIQSGTIAADTMVWPGFGGWISAGSSTLGPRLAPRSLPVPPPIPDAPRGFTSVFKTKSGRLALLIVGLLVGLYAIMDGLGDIRSGLDLGDASKISIEREGCRGISTDAVQCEFQNVGAAEGKVCMDVVVICSDGRHVASTCTDPIAPGQGTTKVVNNFSPAIQPTTACTDIQYENVKASD